MEFSPIKIRFHWTEAAAVQAYRWHQQGSRFAPRNLIIYAILGALIIAGNLGLRDEDTSRAGLVMLSLGLFLLFFRSRINEWFFRLRFRKSPLRDLEVEKEFTTEGVVTRTKLATEDLKWSAFSKLLETTKGVLLYTDPAVFHWVPKSCFDNEEDYGDLVVLAMNQAGNYQSVGMEGWRTMMDWKKLLNQGDRRTR